MCFAIRGGMWENNEKQLQEKSLKAIKNRIYLNGWLRTHILLQHRPEIYPKHPASSYVDVSCFPFLRILFAPTSGHIRANADMNDIHAPGGYWEHICENRDVNWFWMVHNGKQEFFSSAGPLCLLPARLTCPNCTVHIRSACSSGRRPALDYEGSEHPSGNKSYVYFTGQAVRQSSSRLLMGT